MPLWTKHAYIVTVKSWLNVQHIKTTTALALLYDAVERFIDMHPRNGYSRNY